MSQHWTWFWMPPDDAMQQWRSPSLHWPARITQAPQLQITEAAGPLADVCVPWCPPRPQSFSPDHRPRPAPLLLPLRGRTSFARAVLGGSHQPMSAALWRAALPSSCSHCVVLPPVPYIPFSRLLIRVLKNICLILTPEKWQFELSAGYASMDGPPSLNLTVHPVFLPFAPVKSIISPL